MILGLPANPSSSSGQVKLYYINSTKIPYLFCINIICAFIYIKGFVTDNNTVVMIKKNYLLGCRCILFK